MTRTWNREVDVLVAGSGAAGMTAAIAAADAGLSTLIVESTDRWGGTTMRSGGGLWMPNNPIMKRLGIRDSREEALTYLEASIGPVDGIGPASSQERREAFVDAVPSVVEMLERLGVRWAASKDYPDYYPDRPGGKVGRAIEVVPINARKLGDWQRTSRIGDAIPVPMKTDDVWLLSRAWSTPSGFIRGARFVFRTLGGLLTGRKLVGMGGGLMLSLGLIVKQQGTELLLNSPLTELVKDDDGRVIGALVTTPQGVLRVRARRGVILGAGGFANNTRVARALPRHPRLHLGGRGRPRHGDRGRREGGRRARPHGRRVVGRLGARARQAAAVRAQRALRPVQHRGRPVGRAVPQRVRELHRLRPPPARAQPHDPGEPVVARRRAPPPAAVHVRGDADGRQGDARERHLGHGRHPRGARPEDGRRREDVPLHDRALQRARPRRRRRGLRPRPHRLRQLLRRPAREAQPQPRARSSAVRSRRCSSCRATSARRAASSPTSTPACSRSRAPSSPASTRRATPPPP